ncbi:2-keto-4-pentenoate hydratase [Streptomyces sp. 900105755]|uniref:Fumarylacetoacetate hydrolase family protein n=1 Tax=Streptomyces sp. 900105755 TaxID=3154389 RepID=A0ABV1T9A3_9ACTN
MQRHDTAAPAAVLPASRPPSDGGLSELAALLRQAEATRTPLPPLTELCAGLDRDGAYAVQAINTRQRLARGDRMVGRKAGLTSLPMQQLGLREPHFGVLYQSMVVNDGGTVLSGELIAPRVEAEIGFVMGRALAGSAVTVDDANAAVAQVLLTAEVMDNRIADWRIGLVDTVADNASAGRIVVGQPVDATPELLRSLRDECLELYVDGRRVALGLGAEVFGDLLEAVAWLARTLHAHGRALHPGELLLTGSVHAGVPLTPGSRLAVRSGTGRLPELTVTVR